ncbi:MAG: serine/threonine protein kinase [Polyangiaceae bacterium]|nr:serine/threonine protein kinase [Polyangiaceae bacterium]
MDNISVPAPDAFSLTEGAVFRDQYEVVRRIDSGAMGTVYEVIDRRTKRRRALKVMLARFADNPEVTERFRREATITADVVSEHVVETFDAGVDATSGLPFLVMELLRGEDLGKMVARGPLPHAEVVTLLMQAASALDRMHGSGIIHRDLKPENLFVSRRDDGAPRLKILDFGIAKVIEKSAPSATTTRNMGTPVYMSPEQVTGAGSVGPAADLYAVGHLAYTMLVGEPYWLEDALAHETVYPLLLRIMEGATEKASVRALRTRKVTLIEGFDAWFAKATAREPEDRFRTASESILALATALELPRPVLPSWFFEQAAAHAPTDEPPVNEEAFPLVPGPPRLPKEASPAPPQAREPALLTLSPVSTHPGLHAAPSKPEAGKSRGRLVVALGLLFFLVGVSGAIFFGRPKPAAQTGLVPPSESAPSAPSANGSAAAPTAASAPTTASQQNTVPANSVYTADVAPSAAAVSSSSAGPSVSGSAGAQAAGASAPTVKRPVKKAPPPSGKGTSKPPITYGDPTRDL